MACFLMFLNFPELCAYFGVPFEEAPWLRSTRWVYKISNRNLMLLGLSEGLLLWVSVASFLKKNQEDEGRHVDPQLIGVI